ncbi:MAG TPA: hypothetical protein VIY08_12245 [Candidatus Nitrosocosmicus sp.]
MQLPSNTTITSAVDDNGNPVSNGGSTPTSITFTVQATAGSNPLDGFQCSLDGGSLNNCNTNNQNQITFNNLTPGQEHIIKIRAVNSQGNVDSAPATFFWFVMRQSPSNNTTSTGGFGGHGGDSVATTGSTNGGHGGNGGADGKYLVK